MRVSTRADTGVDMGGDMCVDMGVEGRAREPHSNKKLCASLLEREGAR